MLNSRPKAATLMTGEMTNPPVGERGSTSHMPVTHCRCVSSNETPHEMRAARDPFSSCLKEVVSILGSVARTRSGPSSLNQCTESERPTVAPRESRRTRR